MTGGACSFWPLQGQLTCKLLFMRTQQSWSRRRRKWHRRSTDLCIYLMGLPVRHTSDFSREVRHSCQAKKSVEDTTKKLEDTKHQLAEARPYGRRDPPTKLSHVWLRCIGPALSYDLCGRAMEPQPICRAVRLRASLRRQRPAQLDWLNVRWRCLS